MTLARPERTERERLEKHMNYYGGKEIAAAFRTVRRNTRQMADEIPESQYDFRAAPDTRSIGQLLVHIGFGPTFQQYVHANKITDMKLVNFPELFQRMAAEERKPRTKADIIAWLTSEGETFASFVEALPDEFLAERLAMAPGVEPATKSRFEMLLGPKEHEMHHRGQLMMLQRMIGVVPHLTRQMQERMARMQAQAPQ
jgi:uncharacterized damage-inducible protein DinB